MPEPITLSTLLAPLLTLLGRIPWPKSNNPPPPMIHTGDINVTINVTVTRDP